MDDKLKSRLLKLLALSNSQSEGGLEGEAQAAAATLSRLLEAHNLDIADLEQRGAKSRPGVRDRSHDLGKAAFKWKLDLAEEIAEHYYCYPLVDRKAKTVVFVGRPDNVESLVMLYGWLIDQIASISRNARRAHIQSTDQHIDPLRWQCLFGEGASRRLGEWLREQRARQSSEAGSALVLSHKSEVSDWLENKLGFRVDGQMTRRQRESLERYERHQREEAERLANMSDEERAERDRLINEATQRWAQFVAEAARREQRNARRRTGRAYRERSDGDYRKDEEQYQARRAGKQGADSINLQPFVGSGKSRDQL